MFDFNVNVSNNFRHAVAWLRDRIPVAIAYGTKRDVIELRKALEVTTLALANVEKSSHHGAREYAGIIFSKDRAMQLHGLLRSYVQHVSTPRPPLTLIYRTTSDAHERAYAEAVQSLSRSNPELIVTLCPEKGDGFRGTLLKVLGEMRESCVYCLVDDDLFIRPVNFSIFNNFDLKTVVPSLRLGRQINWSYVGNRGHTVPELTPIGNELLKWSWTGSECAWAYPMSLDGNIFNRIELLAMARFLEYWGPNSFETGLARAFGPLFSLRSGVCFAQPCLVNAPWNCVQREIANRCGELTEDELLRRWQDGECLDVAAYGSLVANATHVEIAPQFVRRTMID